MQSPFIILMRSVPLTPPTATMIPAGMVYGFCATVWLAVFFAVGDGFVKAHSYCPFQETFYKLLRIRALNLMDISFRNVHAFHPLLRLAVGYSVRILCNTSSVLSR